MDPDFAERLSARIDAAMRAVDGEAQQSMWAAEDHYQIAYTTSRVQGGPHHGKFLVQVFKPVGKGARTAPQEWQESYRREFATRKAAKARALALYRQHSPAWAAKHSGDPV